MRLLLQKWLRPLLTWIAEKFSAAPRQDAVFNSLTHLYRKIISRPSGRGIIVPMNPDSDRFIIFSDQHKGTRNFDDDFRSNEPNYIAALNYYHQQAFSYINLGDGEELWKNKATDVNNAYSEAFKAEANFQVGNRYYRTFGNHDLQWKNHLDVLLYLKSIFKLPLRVYEGIVLRATSASYPAVDIFCTHGHQGDKMSDNNAFSTWVVAHIWAPVQRFLQMNINTPANDFTLRNKHNRLMYEWSSLQDHTLLVTGHTHKPVFASGKYADKSMYKIDTSETVPIIKPTYFNTGCCCFNDGDITGLEIAQGYIRLVKWQNKNSAPERIVLEEKLFSDLVKDLQ